ncbi:hypothetical protein MNQ96_11635 [Sphingopyxis granuli]|uniref:hypothetical protein n=1 Tax=Sphingopyxis granuli TaxID=267128 RepID=UPI001F534BF4|nr:hypothetical protein [Sphingopyxis granuli]UNK78235.1 hypothetical protein MNQ96_11635 [Sphingopyxis granuli]
MKKDAGLMKSYVQEAFDTLLSVEDGALAGPWRTPLQMLAGQSYDEYASIHDDGIAQKLGFRAGQSKGRHISANSRPWIRRYSDAGGIRTDAARN